jgi:hypothetical protein
MFKGIILPIAFYYFPPSLYACPQVLFAFDRGDCNILLCAACYFRLKYVSYSTSTLHPRHPPSKISVYTAAAAVKHSIKKDLISVLECRLGNCLSSFNQVNGAARPWIFNGHIHGLCAYTDIFQRARVALYIATSSAFRFYIRVYVSYNRYSVLLHSYFSSSFHALNLEI